MRESNVLVAALVRSANGLVFMSALIQRSNSVLRRLALAIGYLPGRENQTMPDMCIDDPPFVRGMTLNLEMFAWHLRESCTPSY